jgi:hypothetical protein
MQVDTSSKVMGGPVIRNIKRMSKPEPFEGDELITSLNGTVGFTSTGFILNPGNPASFPWFSKIASLYERYKFTLLEFYFQHDVSQFAAQGQSGLVLLSALYDAASAGPTSKQQIEASDPRVICMPNENCILSLEPKGMFPTGTPKFVRGVSLPGGTDIKTYDAGTLYASTQGMQGNTEIGELHVRYKGLLYDRILDSSQNTAPQNYQVSVFDDAAQQALATTVNKIAPIATVTTNGLGISNNGGALTVPAGNYTFHFSTDLFVAGGTVVAASSLAQKNGVNIVGSGSFFAAASAAGTTSTTLNGFGYFTSNGTDALQILINATFSGTANETSTVLIYAV